MASSPLRCSLRLTLAAVLPLAFVGSATSQRPIDTTTPDTHTLADPHGICEVDGQRIGIGPGFRVNFRDGGFTFLPALGRRAPRSMPMGFTLASIERGTVKHAGSWIDPRPTERRGDMLIRRLTPTIRERVEMRADGAELTYSLARRPAGTGDLMVRSRIDTELKFSGAVGNGDLRFTFEGHGGVRIGGVFGVDATGHRVQGGLTYEGEHLTLSLPGRFLDHATYPVVLDPILTTELTQASADSQDPDAARTDLRALRSTLVLVWSEEFSATQSEIRALSGAQPIVVRSSSSLFAVEPAIGYVRGAGTMLVAWQEAPTPFGPWDVNCATLSTFSNAASPAQLLARRLTRFPGVDVGGERTTGHDTGLVVFGAAGTGIQVSVIRPGSMTSPPSTVSTAVVYPDSGSTQRVTPSISRCGGNTGRYLVAWRNDPTGATGTISARLIGRNGAPLDAGPFQVDVGGYEPDVDGNGTDFLVGWERPSGATHGPRDVRCRMLGWNGSALVNRGMLTDFAGQSSLDEREAAVGYEPEGFVIAWTRDTGTPFDREVATTVLLSDQCIRCRDVLVVDDHGRDASPVILPAWCSGFTRSGPLLDLIAHAVQDTSPPFRSSVRAGTFEFRASQGSTRQPYRLEPLGAGGYMSPGGRFYGPASVPGLALGSAAARLSLVSAIPNRPTVLLLALGTVRYSVLCTLTGAVIQGDVQIPLLTDGSGSASVSFPIPCDPQLLLLPITGQWVTPTPGVPLTNCPLTRQRLDIAASTIVEYRVGG